MPENNEILQISDGTTIISLIDPDFGFWLDKWIPAIADYKRGGTWQNSSLATGRRLVQKKFENTVEKFTVKLVAEDEELGIENLQKILRLFEKASDYWTTDWQDEMVWIEARGACETNSRFAIIHRGRIPDLQDPYAQPWFGGLLDRAVMENLSIIIERGDWLATQPGTSTCVQISGTQVWEFDPWSVNSTDPTGKVASMIETNLNSLLAGEDDEIWRSTDGENWTGSTTDPTGVVQSLVQVANGDILAGASGGMFKSTDDGINWTLLQTDPDGGRPSGIYLQESTGYVYATEVVENQRLYRSLDNGDTWEVIYTLTYGNPAGIFAPSDGNIYFYRNWSPTGDTIERSIDGGINFTVVKNVGDAKANPTFVEIDGIFYMGSYEKLFRSLDGITWTEIAGVFRGDVGLITKTSDGIYYLTDADDLGDQVKSVWRSFDTFNWQEVVVLSSGTFNSQGGTVEFSVNNRVYAGDRFNIHWNGTETTLGRTATCDNEVYITNHQNLANITDIKIDDAGVFSDIFPASLPVVLLPTVPVVNDAVLFGINVNTFDSGPFHELIFDINRVVSSTTSHTLIWEYYNGAWVTLTVQDNTAGIAGAPLSNPGVNSVQWVPPDDWVSATIDSVTALWIRLRVSALSGIMTPPIQQNRDVYTGVLPYVNIESDQILGDIPAISRNLLQNQSDKDGSNVPFLPDNRIVVGLRSYDRGNNFQAYLNASDEQNPAGVTVTVGADGSFIDDITAPTGRAISFDPAASATIAAAVTFTLNSTIARDFYGKFHAFVRGNMLGGVANEVGIRLQVINGSGGITFTTETKFFQSIADWELIDLGRITIPVGGVLKSTDLGDQTQLIIQASTTSGIYAPDVRIYDLVLMPVDEWQGDFVDFANVTDSIIGRNNDLSKYLDIDSITNPKVAIQSLVRIVGSDLITSIYNPITPGEAILQANAQQRLWFLSARTSATGTAFQWISEPWVAHSVQLFKNQRYLAMRGDN